MKEFSIPYPIEQSLACRSLVLVAKNTSSAADKIVWQMLTVFTAAATYLIGQLHSQFANLKEAFIIYLVAALLAIIQRMLAMVVTNSAKVFQEAEKLNENKSPVDLARFLIIYIDSISGLQRAAAAWSAIQLMKGDLVATGRGLFKLTLWQCVFGSVCIGLLLWSAWVGLKNL